MPYGNIDLSHPLLAQEMVCCLTAPNPYPNQCWLIIIGFCGLRAISQGLPKISTQKVSLKNTLVKSLLYFAVAEWVGLSRSIPHFQNWLTVSKDISCDRVNYFEKCCLISENIIEIIKHQETLRKITSNSKYSYLELRIPEFCYIMIYSMLQYWR